MIVSEQFKEEVPFVFELPEYTLRDDTMEIDLGDENEVMSTSVFMKRLGRGSEIDIVEVKDRPKVKVEDKYEPLLSTFQSVGITSELLYTDKMNNNPFGRQHKYLENVGPLFYSGKEIDKINFPMVGYEQMTKKYLGCLGLYHPQWGVISCNKVSHIVYGMAEMPEGYEMIVFNIRLVDGGFVSFQWDRRGLRQIGKENVTGYYIETSTNVVLINGTGVSKIYADKLVWYAHKDMDDRKDYIINVDGVCYVLPFHRQVVAHRVWTNIFIGKECIGQSFEVGNGTVVYDIDEKRVVCGTNRPQETIATYKHVMYDVITVQQFKSRTKILNEIEYGENVLVVECMIPPNAEITDFNNNGLLVFDRSRSRCGTSKNYLVFCKIRETMSLKLMDGNWSSDNAYIGNNMVYKKKKKYYIIAKYGSKLYEYDFVYVRVHVISMSLDIMECQLGSLVKVRILKFHERLKDRD